MRRMRPGSLFVLAWLLIVPAAAAAQSMERSQWVSKMREVMPAAFCKDGTYFRTCFSVDTEGCRAAASAAMDACLQRYEAQMPTTFRNPEEGGRWGRVVGACAGTQFESGNRKLKRSLARCNDPKAWQ